MTEMLESPAPETIERERFAVLQQLEDWMEVPLLVLGFAWLANSAIQITVNTAIVTCMSIAFALMMDLLLLPILFLLTDKRDMAHLPIKDSDALAPNLAGTDDAPSASRPVAEGAQHG